MIGQAKKALLSEGFVVVPGGRYTIGSETSYPEEKPVIEVSISEFRIAKFAVTNDEFATFVAATGYSTTAELPLQADDYPDMPEEMLVAGSLVFTGTDGPVPLSNHKRWWEFVPGASWRHPEGPGSDLAGREQHPVVQVSHVDALAYCLWKGFDLPTETQWEIAAKGGVETTFPWGEDLVQDGCYRANTWHGEFPWRNTRVDGYERTAPVDAFGPCGYGTYNMLGNVWEWTASPYVKRHSGNCCVAKRKILRDEELEFTIKGGSFLCAPSYCRRYRSSARSPQHRFAATNHIGFRCIVPENRNDDAIQL